MSKDHDFKSETKYLSSQISEEELVDLARKSKDFIYVKGYSVLTEEHKECENNSKTINDK